MTRDEVLAIIAEARQKCKRANLYGADLCGADLREADLRVANLCGADLRVANLRGASLREANLRGAYLRGAYLREANLYGADLCGANLCGADLRVANLREANLREAYLREANLRRANLRGANLRGADLREADLRVANLCGADLREANLCGADLNGIKTNYLTIGIHPAPEGKLIGWGKKSKHIVKMEIPEDSPRSCATTRKFRCHFADVLEIDGKTTGKIEHSWNGIDIIVYEVGQRVYSGSWDAHRWNECSHGIHFFLTREEAEAWS